MSFSSSHKGIYFRKERNKWAARIMISGLPISIGDFSTEEEAIVAYEAKAATIPGFNDRKRSKSKKRPIFPRDENGLITRVCPDCGQVDKFKKAPQADRCKSCGIKESFRHRPAVGLKILPGMPEIIQAYKNGKSPFDIAKEHGVTEMTIRNKLIEAGIELRTRSESHILYHAVDRMHDRLKEMCKTGEFQKNRSAMLQGIPVEEWEGFTTPENKRFYQSPEYKELQSNVFKRDDYTCQWCKVRGGELQLHHIKPKSKYDHLKFDIGNCITLCHACHNVTKNNEQNYQELFFGILNGVDPNHKDIFGV